MTDHMTLISETTTGPGSAKIDWQGEVAGKPVSAFVEVGPRGVYRWATYAGDALVSCAEGDICSYAQSIDPAYALRRVQQDIAASIDAAQGGGRIMTIKRKVNRRYPKTEFVDGLGAFDKVLASVTALRAANFNVDAAHINWRDVSMLGQATLLLRNIGKSYGLEDES